MLFNTGPIDFDFVKEAIELSRADRSRRAVVLDEARATRRRARQLKRRALASREAALAQRWGMWSAGLASLPDYIPGNWGQISDVDELLLRAASTCRECRDVALPRRPFRPIGALCEVTAERVSSNDPESELYLSATARLIERLESQLDTVTGEDAVLVGAFARCRDSCRAALAALQA